MLYNVENLRYHGNKKQQTVSEFTLNRSWNKFDAFTC